MKSIAQVGVLSSDVGHARRQLGVHKCSEHGDDPAGHPHRENQHRRVYLARDYVRVDEDAGADNAAHHDHDGVKQSDSPQEM